MALGVPRIAATPRYSATRGHSVLRKGYVPSMKAPVGGIMPASSHAVRTTGVGLRPGLGVKSVRTSRAMSEPPVRPGFRARSMASAVSPSPRQRYDYDNIEEEYTSALAGMTVNKGTNAAEDADDIYNISRARDRVLLQNANNAVANATMKPAVSRRVASQTVTSSPQSQVDDPDYISPLYPEFDIDERSRPQVKKYQQSSVKTKPAYKLGDRPVAARAKVNLKRGQMTRRGGTREEKLSPVGRRSQPGGANVPAQAATIMAQRSLGDYTFEPLPSDVSLSTGRAMSLPPRTRARYTVPGRGVRTPLASVQEKRVQVTQKSKEPHTRTAMSSNARKGAQYGNTDKGRAAAIVINRGKRFRPLRDHKTPIQPLHFDGEETENLPQRNYIRYKTSSQTPRLPIRRVDNPPVTILEEPRTLIRSKKRLLVNTSPPVKAALLAPTIEIESRRKRTPKSRYGAEKKRQLDLRSGESASAGLHASAPGAAGEKKQVSEKRKEIRKAICRGRKDPAYFY